MLELNKIYHGNSLDILKTFPDKCVDLVFTSPPYNMRTRIRNGKYTTREKSEHFSKKYKYFDDALPIEEFYDFHKRCLVEMLRVSNLVIYNFQIVTGSKEAFFKIIGYFCKEIKDIIIWDKGFGQPAMHEKVLNSAYEMLLILENDKMAGRVINNAKFNRGNMQNILRIGRGKKVSNFHSACFPEKLAEVIIKNFCPNGGVVLDPFMGSGTTGVVAKKQNKNYVGIELSEEYIKMAEERIKKTQKPMI